MTDDKRWKNPNKALDYLEKNKKYFGFSDWNITVIDFQDQENKSVAQTEVDFYEHTLKVSLYKQYAERDDWKETCIHELIHARIGMVQMQFEEATDQIKYSFEEQCVNDIARGIRMMTRT